jgi:hypothetical protein
MKRSVLPHRARGIEIENFALQFLSDKILFVPRTVGNGEHYTFYVEPASGILDVHETKMSSGRSEQHRTLFAMRRDNLPAALSEMMPLLSELFTLLRPLRLGWLRHRGIGIARGVDLISDEDIAAVTRRRKNRLVIDPELYKRNILVPKFLEDVYDFPDGVFALFRRQRRIGMGFKATGAHGEVWLSWVKLTDLMRFGHSLQDKVMSTLASFAIPPEQYPDYPFLRT